MKQRGKFNVGASQRIIIDKKKWFRMRWNEVKSHPRLLHRGAEWQKHLIVTKAHQEYFTDRQEKEKAWIWEEISRKLTKDASQRAKRKTCCTNFENYTWKADLNLINVRAVVTKTPSKSIFLLDWYTSNIILWQQNIFSCVEVSCLQTLIWQPSQNLVI